MIAQPPNTRMPEERPKENISAEMKSHRLKLIKIKLTELMKKPERMKVFSANCGKLVIGLMTTSSLGA